MNWRHQNIPTCNQMTAHNGQREVDRLMQFLMGLNDTFNGVRSNILMMTPLPNVRKAYSIVNQDEKQRQRTSGSTENFSIAAAVQNRSNTFSHNFSNNSTTKHCSHCDRDRHTIETCRTLKYYCTFCDKRGHTDDRCRNKRNGGHQGSKQYNKSQQKRGGNPRSSFHAANAADAGPVFLPQESQASTSAPLPNPLHSLSPEQLQQLAQAISTMATQNASGNNNAFANAAGLPPSSNVSINSIFTQPWILDSGATDHITSDPTLFTKTNTTSLPIVNLPNGSVVPITHTGTIPFNSDITLEKVLCVPSFRLNLMSASKVTNSLNCCALLFPTFCVLQDLTTGKMIGLGEQRGGLYYMSPLLRTPSSHQVSYPSNLWHMRLGHPSASRLKLVSPLLSSNNISFDNNCTVCPMAKQTRLPFPLSSITTHAPFDLLHCDICGPHKVPTHSGARFFFLPLWMILLDAHGFF